MQPKLKMRLLQVTVLMAFSLLVASCSNIKGSQESNQIGIDTKKEVVAAAKPEHLTYETFIEKVWDFEKNPQKWVYKGQEPCVIDFYADWCGPCKRVAPIMDEMAKKYNGKVKIYKVNVDEERKLASIFMIQSIPSVLFSPVKGKPMMQTGLLPHDTYVKIIEENLLKKTK